MSAARIITSQRPCIVWIQCMEKMSDHDLEWLKMNKFFVLSEGVQVITMDKRNKALNLWNKSCVPTAIFEIFYACSKHIIAFRKSAYASLVKLSLKKMRSGKPREQYTNFDRFFPSSRYISQRLKHQIRNY